MTLPTPARLAVLAAVLAAPALAQRAAPRGPAAPPEAGPPAAAERYHEAARLYVDGQNAPALAAAEAAVALAPGDARAVALRDLIRQQQPPSPQSEPPPDPPDDPNGGQNPPPETPPETPDRPPPAPQQTPQNRPGSQDPQTPPPGDAPPPAPGRAGMSREQAERILDAVGGDERLLLRQMRRAPSRVRTNEQDW